MTNLRRVCVALSLAWSVPVSGQTLVVTRSSNVRGDPSTSHSPIGHLNRGDTVQKAEPQNIGGYFQINFANVEGWVWSRNVKEVTVTPEPTPSTSSSTALASTAHHKACPIDGEGGSAHQRATDKLKTRTAIPTLAAVDASITLAALLHKGNDENRFTEKAAANIVAFVDTVKSGGKETVNCHSPYTEDYDTHIELSAKTGAAATKRVIIEITPGMRTVAAQQGLDWSTDALKPQIEHKWVRAKGWMMWDYHHKSAAVNTNPNGSFLSRATAWEVHPVTSQGDGATIRRFRARNLRRSHAQMFFWLPMTHVTPPLGARKQVVFRGRVFARARQTPCSPFNVRPRTTFQEP
jgi:Bacterial SH3 domain